MRYHYIAVVITKIQNNDIIRYQQKMEQDEQSFIDNGNTK